MSMSIYLLETHSPVSETDSLSK